MGNWLVQNRVFAWSRGYDEAGSDAVFGASTSSLHHTLFCKAYGDEEEEQLGRLLCLQCKMSFVSCSSA